MTEAPKLKPCPFCGELPETSHGGKYALHVKCGAFRGVLVDAQVWNTRDDAEVQRLVAEARAEAFEEAAKAILSNAEADEPGYKIWDDERPRICEESAYRRIVALSDAPPRQVAPQEAAKVLLDWLHSDNPNARHVVAFFKPIHKIRYGSTGDDAFSSVAAALRALANGGAD